MATKIKTGEARVKLAAAAPELPKDQRSGGEGTPIGYPHLYQIQAGDWRISYAVEHNRLAILVLEVLHPDGTSSKDASQDKMQKKMKVKLLDWPEGAGEAQVPPDVLSKKMKIRWMDLAEEGDARGSNPGGHGSSRIKLRDPGEQKRSGRSTITLLDNGEVAPAEEGEAADPVDQVIDDDRKVTPVDEPSM